jgi:hypothetical protein
VLPAEGERPVYYSNNTQVRMTLNDAVFDLGIVESTTGERIVVRQTARVIMAIPHVKRLAELLNRQLAEYEEQHGPIPSTEPRRRPSAASRAGEA